MSKHDFSWAEFAERRDRLRVAMRARDLDWLVLIHPVLIHWLTGSDAKSYQEFQTLLFSSNESPVVILTRAGECNEYRDDAWVDIIYGWGGGRTEDPIERFTDVACEFGLLGSRVGIDVPAYYLHPYHYQGLKKGLGRSLASESTDWVHDLKLVKSPQEVEYVRRASQIADRAMEAFIADLGAGRTELQLAATIYQVLLSSGSGLAASPINLVTGPRSCFSHGAPTDRILRVGDFGSVEFGATYKRYTSTIGRQFCIGEPNSRMGELYQLVRRASDACIAKIRDGVEAIVPHEAAKEVIAAAGLDRCRVHTTGYGLAPGFPPTWGEPIHMLDHSKYVLRSGMILTVEPPVFLDNEPLGARLIDNVIVTADGAEVLSKTSRELIKAY